jgi:hypothetical protein
MARVLSVVAEDGMAACANGDRTRAAMLVAELIGIADLEHLAAQPVCRLYEEALAGLAMGQFHAARTLFQALRAV